MAALLKNFTGEHKNELARLKGGRIKLFLRLTLGVLGLVLLIWLWRSFIGSDSSEYSLFDVKRELAQKELKWADDLSASQEEYQEWFLHRGSRTELYLFDNTSLLILSSAASIGDGGGTNFLRRSYISLHFGLLRISFILFACFRYWLVAIIGAAIWAVYTFKVYQGKDFLGQSGNGRLFYSGIRSSVLQLGVASEREGVPQVVGLACPDSVSKTILKASEIYKSLEKYSAANETNSALAAIILKHDNYPAYISDNASELERTFQACTLAENAKLILEEILSLHAEIKRGEVSEVLEEDIPGKINGLQYAKKLKLALQGVLTAQLKQSLAALPAHEIATLVLTCEAGKVMSYAYEGGKWLKKSNFPQLCARSVLYSIADFATEHSDQQRADLRRALVFASRRSVFGPVRFPVDLTDSSRALRQWAELLMACPNELKTIREDVELFGIMEEVQRTWSKKFIEEIQAANMEVLEGAFVAPGNLFFMPLKKVLKSLRNVTGQDALARLGYLVNVVSQLQTVEQVGLGNLEEFQEKSSNSGYFKALTPLSAEEIKALSSEHNLSIEELKDWSTLRVILDYFGWFSKRVGDLSVPASSLIFAVFEVDESVKDRNEVGRIGRPAMVPFRATRLIDKWGKSWRVRMQAVKAAYMAESKERFEKLMRGEDDSPSVLDIGQVGI